MGQKPLNIKPLGLNARLLGFTHVRWAKFRAVGLSFGFSFGLYGFQTLFVKKKGSSP
jgi:hypothetical protein